MPRISSTSFITGTGFMKCMPMNLLGPVGRGGQPRDRDRRGVGGDQRVGLQMRDQLLEDLALDLLVLGRRLDDDVAVAEQVVVGARRDALQRRVLVLGAEILPLRDLARPGCGRSSLSAPWQRLGVDVDQLDVEAGERADMGDAAAHLPGADDADGSELIERMSLRRRLADAITAALSSFVASARARP